MDSAHSTSMAIAIVKRFGTLSIDILGRRPAAIAFGLQPQQAAAPTKEWDMGLFTVMADDNVGIYCNIRYCYCGDRWTLSRIRKHSVNTNGLSIERSRRVVFNVIFGHCPVLHITQSTYRGRMLYHTLRYGSDTALDVEVLPVVLLSPS